MKLLRSFALVLAVVAVAGLGLWSGSRLRPEAPLPVRPPDAPSQPFAPGMPFPVVRLEAEDGTWTDTRALLLERGAVVLLLDLECSPCGTMAEQWSAHVASDSLKGLRVVGITAFPPDRVAGYRRQHAMPFPVYADTASAFTRRHGVNDFPMCVMVDAGMVVRGVTFDPYAELSADSLRLWVRP